MLVEIGSKPRLVRRCLLFLRLPAGSEHQVAAAGENPGGPVQVDDSEGEGVVEDIAEADVVAVVGMARASRIDLDIRLRSAWCEFRRWVRESSLETGAEVWTCKRLGCTGPSSVPQLGGKGADQRLTLLWLNAWMGRVPECTRKALAAAIRPLDLDLVSHAVHLLAYFVHQVSMHDVILPEETQVSLRRCTDHFTKFYLALAEQAVQNLSTLFKVRPKLHALWEIGEHLGPLSPNCTSCMLDETYMGVVGRICAATHRCYMPRRVLDRYLHMLDSVLQEASKGR